MYVVGYEILPPGRLFTNVFFFFPENVIMARLEFIKLHCIEELTEQQTPFLTQGHVGFSVHPSDHVSAILINLTLVKSQGSSLGHKSVDLCTFLIKTCHYPILWVQFSVFFYSLI